MTSPSSLPATSTTTILQGAIIFLHGLGDDGSSLDGWETSLEQQLVRYHPELSPTRIVYVFPRAPRIPISISGGTEMPAWFDLYDWPIDVVDYDADTENVATVTTSNDNVNTIIQSVSTINMVITECMSKYQLQSQQIIVGGFSQGGAIALLTAFHPIYGVRNGNTNHTSICSSSTSTSNSSTTMGIRIGGCINLSGWIPLSCHTTTTEKNDEWTTPTSVVPESEHTTSDNSSSSSSSSSSSNNSNNGFVPLFWGHGIYDEIVALEHQQRGMAHLQSKGLVPVRDNDDDDDENSVVVQARQYPMEHTSDPNKEMKDVADFIHRILFS